MATTLHTDLETLNVDLKKELFKMQAAYTPAFARFAVYEKSNMDTKHVWTYALYSKLQDQLAEALDDSETGVDVDGSTSSNKIAYVANHTAIRVDLEWMLVTGVSGTTLTVTRGWAGSTAAAHSDNAPVYVIPISALGTSLIGRNDGEFGTREYNVLQNAQKEFPLANPVKKMTSFTTTKEYELAHQKSIWDNELRLAAEDGFFWGTRYNTGTAAPTTASLTMTAAAGQNMAGGIVYFNGQHGGRSTTYSNHSIDNIRAGIQYLAKRNAFSASVKNEYGDGEALVFVSPESFDLYQNTVQAFENYNDGKNTEFGSNVLSFRASGYRATLLRSDRITPGRQVMIPNRKDAFKIIIKRWGEDQDENPSGDQKATPVCYSWTYHIGSGLLTEVASGLPTS